MENFPNIENNENLSDVEKLLSYFWSAFSCPLYPPKAFNIILDNSISNSIDASYHLGIKGKNNLTFEQFAELAGSSAPINNIVPLSRKS